MLPDLLMPSHATRLQGADALDFGMQEVLLLQARLAYREKHYASLQQQHGAVMQEKMKLEERYNELLSTLESLQATCMGERLLMLSLCVFGLACFEPLLCSWWLRGKEGESVTRMVLAWARIPITSSVFCCFPCRCWCRDDRHTEAAAGREGGAVC